MQTFHPRPGFVDGARLLDSPRRGKHHVETLQILRALFSVRLDPAALLRVGLGQRSG